MKSTKLIADLTELTWKNIQDAQTFAQLSDAELNHRNSPDSWNILECLEHLNRYGDFYIPEIRKRIKNSRFQHSDKFSSGILGNYFAESMLPRENFKKIKTFRSMNPIKEAADRNIITQFLKQQEDILYLLEMAKKKNLTKTKTSISISKWIKLRLGDTLRVVIYHNYRHIKQAKDCLEKRPAMTQS